MLAPIGLSNKDVVIIRILIIVHKNDVITQAVNRNMEHTHRISNVHSSFRFSLAPPFGRSPRSQRLSGSVS